MEAEILRVKAEKENIEKINKKTSIEDGKLNILTNILCRLQYNHRIAKSYLSSEVDTEESDEEEAEDYGEKEEEENDDDALIVADINIEEYQL